MPKNPSKDLFLLIKSLSGSEKVHLVKNVLKKGQKEPVYFRLFNLIAKQPEHDEKLILQNFAGMNQTSLSDKKYQLYNLIVNNLSERQKSTEAELRKMLNRIEFLYGKLLYDQAYEIVKKGEEICNKCQYFTHLLLFLEWELYIQATLYLDDHVNKKAKRDLIAEISSVIKKIKSLDEYHSLYRQILHQERVSFYRPGTEENDPFIKYMSSPLLLKEPDAETPDLIKIYYYLCRGCFYNREANYKKAELYLGKAVLLFEKNESLKVNNPFDYIHALSRRALGIMYLGDIQTYDKIIRKLIDFNMTSTLGLKQYHFAISYIYLIRSYIYKSEFNKAISIVDECKSRLKKEGLNLESYHLIYLHYHFFEIYFGAGLFRNADKELAYINNQLKTENYSLDLQAFARVLSVIVCYEKKEYVLLSSLSRSAYRFLEKRKLLSSFEKILLKFIEKSVYINSSREQEEHFTLLKENLLQSVEKDYIHYACSYFDFMSWIESKISNKSFVEVLKSKKIKV